MEAPQRPRRFRPLDPAKQLDADERPVLKGIVFDVDGTLCEPQNYMFAEMRAVLNIPKSTDILTHIYSLPPSDSEAAMEKVRAIERTAMASQKPQTGLVALMDYLDTRSIRKGICTRNFNQPVSHLLTTFLPDHVIHPIITRDFRPPKPDPAGILHIARTWLGEKEDGDGEGDDGGATTIKATALPTTNSHRAPPLTAQHQAQASAGSSSPPDGSATTEHPEIPLLMVGDSLDDMTAGFRAGAATVLLLNDVNKNLVEHEHTDLVIRRLDELIGVLENGFEGRVEGGKEHVDAKGLVEKVLREGAGN